MLLSVGQVVTVPEVPVGSFFLLKAQGGEPRFAFMAQQIAKKDGDFSGPVVLSFPNDGRYVAPRRATDFALAVAAILPDVRATVDLADLGDSSTETLGVPAGLLLQAGDHQLVTVAWGELDAVTSVNLDTGEYRLGEAAGNWLSFKKWNLQTPDGTVLYTGEVMGSPR